MSKKRDIISIVTIIVGFIGVLVSIIYYFDNKSELIENGEFTEGFIVAYEENMQEGNSNYKLPVVEFQIKDDTIKFTNETPIISFVKESKVHVMYDPDNPNNAMIYEEYMVQGIPLSIGIISILTSLFGGIMLYFSKKGRG